MAVFRKGTFDNFEFRCSALGNIITASGKLTDTAKTYINDCYIGFMDDVRKEGFGKILDKGKFCEEEGFTLLSKTIFQGKLVVKNKIRKGNGFIRGEWDTVVGDTTIDIKNAYDKFTFQKAKLSHIYEWQLKGYGWLTGNKNLMLFYCLNNTPEPMLQDLERSLFYKRKWEFLSMEDPKYLEACEQLRAENNYDHLPIFERFKFWEFQFTEADKERIKKGVNDARNYMEELHEERFDRVVRNMTRMGISHSEITKYMDTEFKMFEALKEAEAEQNVDFSILKKIK